MADRGPSCVLNHHERIDSGASPKLYTHTPSRHVYSSAQGGLLYHINIDETLHGRIEAKLSPAFLRT
eukprot:scaffold65567_cov31-Prasinocladus_malaysianus.AAC.3